jgi:RNA polymerase sigma-32 factor
MAKRTAGGQKRAAKKRAPRRPEEPEVEILPPVAAEAAAADSEDAEPEVADVVAELDAVEPALEELDAAEPEAEAEPDADLAELDGDSREGLRAAAAAKRERAAESREIARYDPLATYMREVSRYPLLSREAEHELAVKYVEHGEVDAARALVTANLRLVVKIAHEYRRAHQNLLDLVQEGNVGLMQAVKKYDPYQGVKFSSYAAWWIRAYILKYIMSNFRLVKLGTTQAQRKLFFNLKKEKDKLEAQGFDATPKLIAASLDVREDEVREMDERMGHRDLSLDAPLTSSDGGADSTRHIDLLRAAGGNADESLADAELSEVVGQKLREFAAGLPDKERFIYEHRLVAETPITLQELGDRFGISRERARQIEKRIVEKARAHLRKELGRDFDLVAGSE